VKNIIPLFALAFAFLLHSSASAVTVEIGYWIAYTLNDDGIPVAGSGFEISSSGDISGKGVETDGTKITLSGKVAINGAFTILQNTEDGTTRIAGVATSSTSFKGVVSSAQTFYAEFVTDEIGGVYHKKKSGRHTTAIVRTNGKTYAVDYDSKKSIALLRGKTKNKNVKLSGKWFEDEEKRKAKATGRATQSKMNLFIEVDDKEIRLKLKSVY
jgi:hypothetical protein